ncbi:MAG: ABC transporter [Sphingomonadaceae bacterium]|nr:ABC transporter [Sphingomonadaceae bacterium]
MKAGLGRFLRLWLPMLAVLFLGLQRAWLTGQADPWDWGMPAAILLAGMGLWLAPRGWPSLTWVAMGSVGTALIFCTLAALRAPGALASLGLATIALFAVLGGAALRGPWRPAGAILLLLTALLLWRGPVQPLIPVADRPKLSVITALPLFWGEPGKGATGPIDAPIITVLRTRFDVRPLDDPAQLAASGARSLLLAQPRALRPAQLVAIDQWVRAGGRILVLADPLLRWPSALPPGDRRRAPSISLLGPLLAHWGFQPDGPPESPESRHFMPDGGLVTLSAVQPFLIDGDRGPHDGLVLRKRIGRGEVLLLGDADLIDDRLWLADPARPLDPRLWVADTPARVTHWLGSDLPDQRHWMRSAPDVTRALRWALIAATGFAIFGAIALAREPNRQGIRNKS